MFISEIMMRFKTSVYVLLVGIVIIGVGAYRRLPLEAAPEIEIPFILVHTVYPGVSPEDIERLVTNVIERELRDLRDIKQITSNSLESISTVTIEFETTIRTVDAYQRVRDRVDQAKARLPSDAEEPRIIEINTTDFPIMQIIVSGDYGETRLKKVGEELEEKIEQISGVLGVDLLGGLDREIYVYLDPERLEFYKIGVEQVIGRIRQEHRTTPAGRLELGGSRYTVRIPGEYRDIFQMEDIVIKAPEGKPVKISDIGRISDSFKERETYSRLNGTDCITLRIRKQSGANIVEVAESINAVLEQSIPFLPPGTEIRIVQDASEMIRDQVNDVENSIISGLLMVMIVLCISLGFRNASFVAFAIPLSMLITFIVLELMGVTLNFVVLFSLILALGMLVDNSIVVVENIYRHASSGKDVRTAAIDGVKEVIWPIVASTSTTVAAFFPLLFMPGITGDFMIYLPMTVITALIATLFVAAFINPVIAGDFLNPARGKMFDDSGTKNNRLLRSYQSVLRKALRHPLLVVAAAFSFLVFTIILFANIGTGVEFFPPSEPRRAQVSFEGPQGMSLDRTDEVIRQVEAICLEEENSESVIGNSGFSPSFGGFPGSGGRSNMGVVDIEFKDRRLRKRSTWETVASIREQLDSIVGGKVRMKMEEMGPPTGDPISIEISGPDYQRLNDIAMKVIPLVARIPGAIEIDSDFDGSRPEIQIEVDREKAMQRKVNSASIAMAVSTAVNGTVAAVLREGDEEYDIVVRYDKVFRDSIQDILDIRVTGMDSVQIPLRDVAVVRTAGGLGSIKRIDGNRSVKISGEVEGRPSSQVMAEAERIIRDNIQLPPGYEFHFTGENELQDEMAEFLQKAFGIGILLIFLILTTQFNSVIRSFIILASVVLSINGVLLGLLITRSNFSIMMTGMGIVSLAGIVVNNSIVLIDYIDRMRAQGLPIVDALVKAGSVRFRPVFLTAITTMLGMTPMAIGVSIDFKNMVLDIGSENTQWWGPMAQAVIFGLLFATLLTLIVVPVLYLLQERFKVRVKSIISKRKTVTACILVTLLLAPVTTRANDRDDTDVPIMTLEQAIDMALTYNPGIQTMNERLKQSDYLIQQAWSMLMPNVSVNAGWIHHDRGISISLPGENDEFMELDIQKQDVGYAVFNASIAVFNPRAFPLLRYAYSGREAIELHQTHASNDLLVAVVGVYYQIESAKNAVIVASEALANAEEFLRLSKGLSDVGQATRIDVLRAESEVIDAQNLLATAQDAVDMSKTALAALTDHVGQFDIVTPPEYKPVSTDLKQLLENAWQNRKDLEASRLDIRMNEYLRREIQAQWLPAFDLRYSNQWRSSGGLGADNSSWNIELSARWSILDGGFRRAENLRKQSDIRIAEHAVKGLELQIQQEIERNLVELRKSDRSLTLIRKQLAVLEETHRLVKRQYEVGMATSLDLQTAGKNLTSIKQRLVMEELNYALAALMLNKSSGEYLQ
jgi:multidrug efflux pump